MIHKLKAKKGMAYIHTIQWLLFPIKKENFKLSDLDFYIEWYLTDVYWNEYKVPKRHIDIAWDDTWIYHVFHNEDYFNSLNQQQNG
jgi:hypothetical protein